MHADALEALYRDHYRAALLYALSLCGDRDLAEDLVSDAFEAALLTLDDSHPSVRYWLLRVCRHLWLDELRRRKRRPTVPAEGLGPAGTGGGSGRAAAGGAVCRPLPGAEKTAGPAQGASDAPLLQRTLPETGGRAHRDDGGSCQDGALQGAAEAENHSGGGRL